MSRQFRVVLATQRGSTQYLASGLMLLLSSQATVMKQLKWLIQFSLTLPNVKITTSHFLFVFWVFLFFTIVTFFYADNNELDHSTLYILLFNFLPLENCHASCSLAIPHLTNQKSLNLKMPHYGFANKFVKTCVFFKYFHKGTRTRT